MTHARAAGHRRLHRRRRDRLRVRRDVAPRRAHAARPAVDHAGVRRRGRRPIPMETHTYAALNSGDVTNEEIDEFLLFFGDPDGLAQGLGHEHAHPRRDGEDRRGAGRGDAARRVRARGPIPLDDDVRRARGEAAYDDVHGVAAAAGPAPRSGAAPTSTTSTARSGPATSTSPAATAAWSASAAAPSWASTPRPPSTSRPRCAAASSPTRSCRRSSCTSRCTWAGSWPAASTTCWSPPPPDGRASSTERDRPDRQSPSSPVAAGAVARAGVHAREVAGGVHQRHVGERLREVAEHAPRRPGRTPRRAGRRRCARPSSRSNSARASSVRPSSARLSASQNEQGRNTPSPGGSPSTPVVGVVARARTRRPSARAGSPRRCRRSAGRSAGRKPTSGIISVLASSACRAVVLRERVAVGVEALARSTSRWISSRHAAPAVDRAVEAELLDALHRAVERHPGHHLRVDEVAGARRAPPRCPRRGPSSPTRGTRGWRAAAPTRSGPRRCPCARAWCSESSTSPYTSSWNWLVGGVADPHRRRALVAGEPVDLVLGRAGARRRRRT